MEIKVFKQNFLPHYDSRFLNLSVVPTKPDWNNKKYFTNFKQEMNYRWFNFLLKKLKKVAKIEYVPYTFTNNFDTVSIDIEDLEEYVRNKLKELMYMDTRFLYDDYMILTSHKIMREVYNYQLETYMPIRYTGDGLFKNQDMIANVPVILSSHIPEDTFLVLKDITGNATQKIILEDKMELNKRFISLNYSLVDIQELESKLGVKVL